MDICIVIYKNYDLLAAQVEAWRKIPGANLLICDNTPLADRQIIDRPNVFVLDVDGIDGETHGAALDFLVRQATSDIVGICDSDFFWLDPNILLYVEEKFRQGYQCVGAEPWYEDFERVNAVYPDRASWLAPCVFGQFVDRKLALSETFVVSRREASKLMETGWRLRERVIQNRIKCEVLRAFRYPYLSGDSDIEKMVRGAWFYGTPENPVGFHLVKGSSFNKKCAGAIPALFDLAKREKRLRSV